MKTSNGKLILSVLAYIVTAILIGVIAFQLGQSKRNCDNTNYKGVGQDSTALALFEALHLQMDRLQYSQKANARASQLDSLRKALNEWETQHEQQALKDRILKCLLQATQKRIEDQFAMARYVKQPIPKPVAHTVVGNSPSDFAEIQKLESQLAIYQHQLSRIRQKSKGLGQAAINIRRLHSILRDNWIKGGNDEKNRAIMLRLAGQLEVLDGLIN